jgi:hypothetical protein
MGRWGMKGEQAAWPHAFFTSGEQGAEPPGERAAPQGPRFELGEGARSRPLPPVQTIVGYGFAFLGVGKVRNFALSSPRLPEADLFGRGIKQEGIRRAVINA